MLKKKFIITKDKIRVRHDEDYFYFHKRYINFKWLTRNVYLRLIITFCGKNFHVTFSESSRDTTVHRNLILYYNSFKKYMRDRKKAVKYQSKRKRNREKIFTLNELFLKFCLEIKNLTKRISQYPLILIICGSYDKQLRVWRVKNILGRALNIFFIIKFKKKIVVLKPIIPFGGHKKISIRNRGRRLPPKNTIEQHYL